MYTMKDWMIEKKTYLSILFAILSFAGLYLTSLYSYLLFHSLAEMFSIIIACGIFMIAWNSRCLLDNMYFLFIGIAYLFIGGLDLIHTLSYKGMGIFPGYDANLPTQLWIATRYIESLTLLIAPFFVSRKLETNISFLSYVVAIFLLLGTIFYWQIFPDCFIEGSGLTPFKKISEYIISLILVSSIVVLMKRRSEFDRDVFSLIVASIILTIGAELAFTFYVSVYGFSNLIGHYLKIISFYLLYKAIIETGIIKPYNLLFRSLKHSNEALQKARDELKQQVDERTIELIVAIDKLTKKESFMRILLSSLRDHVCSVDRDGIITTINDSWMQFARDNDVTSLEQVSVGVNYLAACEPAASEGDLSARMAIEGIRAVIENRRDHFTMEYPCNSHSKERWFVLTALPLKRAEGGAVISHNDITMRKQAEKIILESEERLKRAQRIAGMGFLDWNLKTNEIYWSDEIYNLFGVEKKERVQTIETTVALVHPDDLDFVQKSLDQAVKGFKAYDIEHRMLRPDGRVVWVHSTAQLRCDPNGDPESLMGTVLDITERRKSEEQLIQAEQRYRTVADYTYDWEYWLNPDGNLIYVSPSCERITGYTVEEFVDNPSLVKDIILPEYRKVWDNYQEDIHAGKKPQDIEIKIQTKKGNIAWIEHAGHLIIDNTGNNLGYRASTREITERKKVEMVLQKSNERFNAFVKNSTEAIFCIDLKRPMDINLAEDDQIDHLYKYSYVSEANDAWARIGGFEHGKDLIGARLEEIIPHTIPENIAFLKEMIRARYRLNGFETVEMYKTGVKIHACNTITGIIDNGHLVRIWGTGRDITEQKRLEEELMRNEKDLRKLTGRLILNQEEELSRLARELHDDLTQQLAVMAIETGQLEQQFKYLPEPVLLKISYIKDQLIKVSKDVHNLSRDLHPSILHDLGLERSVQSECSNFSSRTGIAVIFTPKNIPANVSKEIALSVYRMIQEGLSNIHKHAETKNAYVFLEGSDDNLLITVRDTGVGFDQNQVRQQAALGLGSIRERARLINGKPSITSSPGKGTTIEVSIPLKGE